MDDDDTRFPSQIKTLLHGWKPELAHGEQTPPRLVCRGGDFVNTHTGKWERRKGCGNHVQICESVHNVDGQRLVTGSYATGLCERCAAEERDGRAYMRARSASGE
jgi:hypothetical protein